MEDKSYPYVTLWFNQGHAILFYNRITTVHSDTSYISEGSDAIHIYL